MFPKDLDDFRISVGGKTLNAACCVCLSKLRVSHTSVRRFTTLEGEESGRVKVRKCVSDLCPLKDIGLHPSRESSYVLPNLSYGVELMCLIGQAKEQRRLPTFLKELKGEGIDVGRSTAYCLVAKYKSFLSPCLETCKVKLARYRYASLNIHRVLVRNRETFSCYEYLEDWISRSHIATIRCHQDLKVDGYLEASQEFRKIFPPFVVRVKLGDFLKEKPFIHLRSDVLCSDVWYPQPLTTFDFRNVMQQEWGHLSFIDGGSDFGNSAVS